MQPTTPIITSPTVTQTNKVNIETKSYAGRLYRNIFPTVPLFMGAGTVYLIIKNSSRPLDRTTLIQSISEKIVHNKTSFFIGLGAVITLVGALILMKKNVKIAELKEECKSLETKLGELNQAIVNCLPPEKLEALYKKQKLNGLKDLCHMSIDADSESPLAVVEELKEELNEHRLNASINQSIISDVSPSVNQSVLSIDDRNTLIEKFQGVLSELKKYQANPAENSNVLDQAIEELTNLSDFLNLSQACDNLTPIKRRSSVGSGVSFDLSAIQGNLEEAADDLNTTNGSISFDFPDNQ
jgi:hypothetical protein